MHGLIRDADPAQLHAQVFAHRLVVIAGNEDDLSAILNQPQHLLQHLVMLHRPVDAGSHAPQVNHVPHQVERLAGQASQESNQVAGLAPPAAEVRVADEDGSVVKHVLSPGSTQSGTGPAVQVLWPRRPACDPRLSQDSSTTPVRTRTASRMDRATDALKPGSNPWNGLGDPPRRGFLTTGPSSGIQVGVEYGMIAARPCSGGRGAGCGSCRQEGVGR